MSLMPFYESSIRYMSATVQIQQKVRQFYGSARFRQSWALLEFQGSFYLSYIYGYFYPSAQRKFLGNCVEIAFRF